MHVWFSLFVLLRRICLVWTNATRRSPYLSIVHLPISRSHGVALNRDYTVIYGISLSRRFVKFLFISAHSNKTDLLNIFKSIRVTIVC